MSKQTGRVLRRKLGALRSRGYSFPLQSRLAEVLEFAAAKGASGALGATVEATVAHTRVQALSGMIEDLPDRGLFVVMGAGDGEAGLFALEMSLVDHFVDILSGGSPDEWEEAPPRAPTTVERALTLVDRALTLQVAREMMAVFHAELRALAADIELAPMACDRAEHHGAGLQFLLPDRKYLVLRGTLDIGDGPRGGDFRLALPLGWLEPVEEAVRRLGLAGTQGESERWQRHMRQVVRATPLPLVAVLDRCRMSVAELSRLKVGETFPLSDSRLDDVVLELDTGGSGRRRVARGRLGARKRSKAVKLAEPPDPELFAALAAALDPGPEPD